MTKKDLDLIVLNIEFLLISVVQGVAFSTLASVSAPLIASFSWEYWPAIIGAFALVLIFWSQAIIHSLSFVDWPIDISHSFLYFLASFIELIAFIRIADPLEWFGFNCLFFVVVWFLYAFDLRLIREHRDSFLSSPSRKKLFEHILKRQEIEKNRLGPFGVGYTLVCLVLILLFPAVFLDQGWHVLLSSIQSILLIIGLFRSVASYRTRTNLLTACIEKE